MNGDESGVDCGGACPVCGVGSGCRSNAECNPFAYCRIRSGETAGTCTRATIAALGAGDRFTCALLGEHGKVACWGAGESGRLGLGDTQDRVVPTFISDLSGVVRLSVGRDHACAVTGDGGLWCWGDNAHGKVGVGGGGGVALAPVRLPFGAVLVAAGTSHTCITTTSQTAQCWGLNEDGQLGNDATVSSAVPVDVKYAARVLQLSAGRAHTCARFAAGEGWCWGDNAYRQVLGALGADRLTPLMLGSDAVAQVAAGGQMSCHTTLSRSVRCRGWNSDTAQGSAKVEIGAQDVDCDNARCCAAAGSGGVLCWENGSARAVTGLDAATKVAVGAAHACSATNAGVVTCWGVNAHGELGHGAVGPEERPPGGVARLSE
jgi:hypothetical protein